MDKEEKINGKNIERIKLLRNKIDPPVICEAKDLYKLMEGYVLEQSSAEDYITNYMEITLKYIADRIMEDGYDIFTKREADWI